MSYARAQLADPAVASALPVWRRFAILFAAAALQRGPVRLKQLAVEWGFYDASHFCRSYKRYFGVAPSRDRER